MVEELGIGEAAFRIDQDVVRRLQEIAYTRYVGTQTEGGATPSAAYNLEPANKVYEKVALWFADKYPLIDHSKYC